MEEHGRIHSLIESAMKARLYLFSGAAIQSLNCIRSMKLLKNCIRLLADVSVISFIYIYIEALSKSLESVSLQTRNGCLSISLEQRMEPSTFAICEIRETLRRAKWMVRERSVEATVYN